MYDIVTVHYKRYLSNMPLSKRKDSWIHYNMDTFALLFTQQTTSSLNRLKYKTFFSYRVTVVERVTKFLQAVEVLDIVFGLVGCISDSGVQFPPRLDSTNPHCI